MMNDEKTKKPKRTPKSLRLLTLLQKAKPEFKPYKFNIAVELLDRLENIQSVTELNQDQINDALNFAVRRLVTQLEREAAGITQDSY
jgi:hypothetical protein